MNQFESTVKVIPYSQQRVYITLSDLNNLEAVKDKLPADKIQEFSFNANSMSFNASPVGQITLQIIEREPEKSIKFEAIKSPLPFYLWIQLLSSAEEECKIKLTIQAELNPFIKGMVQKPLQEGLEKIAEVLASISY